MNYTIFTIPQITPRFVTVHGPYGDIQAPNTHPTVYPAGTTLNYEPPTLDIWSDDPALRKVLIADPHGTATAADVDISLPEFRVFHASKIRIEGEKRLNTLAGHYLPAERETWPYQREEALRWKEGGMQQTPYCDAIATGRGITREAFMTAVLENTSLFSQYSSAILGQQQAILDRIYAATTVDAIINEAWPVSP